MFSKLKRSLKCLTLQFLRSAKSPYMASGGFACGALVHFYPTFGAGFAIALILAKLTNTSILTCSLGYSTVLPLFPFLFYTNFITGEVLTHESIVHTLSASKMSLLKFSTWLSFGKAFVVGSIVNGVLGFIALWYIGYIVLKKYRKPALEVVKKW